jgi:hypothetical protein
MPSKTGEVAAAAMRYYFAIWNMISRRTWEFRKSNESVNQMTTLVDRNLDVFLLHSPSLRIKILEIQ